MVQSGTRGDDQEELKGAIGRKKLSLIGGLSSLVMAAERRSDRRIESGRLGVEVPTYRALYGQYHATSDQGRT